MLPTFENGHFIKVCTERMMDRQYGENGARNIYSNYNQMRAYVECFPNQPPFHRAIDETLKITKVLAVSVSEFYYTITVQLYQPTLISWLSLLDVYK